MMNTTILITILASPLLLYLPGWALSQVLLRIEPDVLERHYERVAISALFSGWLALLLAELGLFSLWLQLGITLSLSGALWLLGRTREQGNKGIGGRRHETGASKPSSLILHPSSFILHWETLAYAVVLLIALALAAQPFEIILGVRDAGVYANTGLAIARTGSLVQSDPLLADLGQAAASNDPALAEPAKQALSNFLISQQKTRYLATRLRAAGFFVNEGEADEGRVVPQGLHLLPAWIGLLAAGGPMLGLFAPGLLAVLGVWSVGMLGRRLGGSWVGLLAMLFLALNGVQVWFARYSTAETTAQFLIWCGLYFFAKMHGDGKGPQPIHAAMAGIAIGQVALARIDFFLLGPALAYLLYCWISRRWNRPQTWLAVGMGVMLLHAGLHIAFIARAYFFDTGYDRIREYALVSLLSLPFLTPEVRQIYLTAKGSGLASPRRIALESGALIVGIGALLLLRWRVGFLHRIETVIVARSKGLLNLAFVAVLLLAGYAYFVRPQIIDADVLFNTRGGWSDPLTRDPRLVTLDVRQGRMTTDEARLNAGVVLQTGKPYWFAEPDLAATAELRERLAAERGPWQGPFSNQTMNWLRLQGYVGAPISLPVKLWYNEYEKMSWWQRLTIDPATLSSEPAPERPKYLIPLANLVRMGWYLSPLGIILGALGFALWLRRGLNKASWLFFAVALFGTFFFVRQTYGTSDQHYIYILRRFVPIAYPAFSLGMGYAIATLGQNAKGKMQKEKLTGIALYSAAATFSLLNLVFFIYTNRPIYGHVEYRGAIEQLTTAARMFDSRHDILLMRGGGPIYAEARDVPDLVATPLRFAFGLDAFTVKSSSPGEYADALAAQVANWRAAGREVYLLLSASGGSFALPGYNLEPAGQFSLNLPEFEQLTDQKPRNVSRLSLPFAIYRLVPSAPGQIAAPAAPVAPDNFAAQVSGFYQTEQRAATSYAWTNGDALLRIAWPIGSEPQQITLHLAGGKRPAHLGPAEVCLSAQPETSVWPTATATEIQLGCLTLSAEPAGYSIKLDPATLPPAPSGSLLLRIESRPWVPAAEDPQQNDQRAVGVQFGGLEIARP